MVAAQVRQERSPGSSPTDGSPVQGADRYWARRNSSSLVGKGNPDFHVVRQRGRHARCAQAASVMSRPWLLYADKKEAGHSALREPIRLRSSIRSERVAKT